MTRTLTLSLLSAAILAAPAIAEENFRQHDAHVHGVVELNIAQDGKQLLVEMTAPGADVVGFEHAPKNDQQRQTLSQAEKLLMQPKQILLLSSKAECRVTHANVSHTLEAHEHHHDDDHEQHDHGAEHKHDDHHEGEHEHHDHDAEHKHDDHHEGEHEHHDHDAEHKHHDHHEDEHDHDDHKDCNHSHDHGEFKVEYQFQCDNMEQLSQIDTQWFKHFPNTEKISVNLITEKHQLAAELSPNSHNISL